MFCKHTTTGNSDRETMRMLLCREQYIMHVTLHSYIKEDENVIYSFRWILRYTLWSL